MSKAITFFRNRRQETGHTYELDIQDSARPYRLYIYARKPLEDGLVRSRQLRGTAREEVDKILQALARGDGGVVASTYEEGRGRVLAIFPAASAGRAASGSFGLLLPGHPSLGLEPVTDKQIHFPPGSHAVIPVDRDAEESLRNFREAAANLPPDLESLALHALRDPSLDTRMSRLEAVVLDGKGKPVAGPTRGGAGVAGPWYKSWFKRPVPVWPVAAGVLALMLAINSWLLYSVLQAVNGSVVLPFRAGPTGSGGGAAAATPEQKVFAVVEAVRARTADPRFAALAQGHFARVRTADDVARVLGQSDEGRLLVRGLLKLEALRLDAAAAGDLFGSSNNASAVNTFFTERSLGADDRERLAALACAAFPSPELPAASSATAVRLADTDQTCRDFPLTRAGLDDLLELVQEAD